ncbi:MAG: Fosmidomycin resistance protein [Syntrophorhabdaceae bacterium PtaU1.Bin034]|nr:MAG: Fosmidomycin resistance protein [Syntrophorhabdaceae bacterium PtaU1.Bin034]
MRKFNLKVLLLLSLGHMTVDIYQGALPATLPFIKENLGLTYTMTGLIMIVSNFTSSILQPLFGFLSDKKEKAFLLPLGVFSAGLGYSLLSLPSHYFPVLALVTISGLGVASYHPEGYKTAAFFTGRRAATGMSVFSVGGNLGFALGPIIAIWTISRFGFTSLPLVIIPSLLFTAAILVFRRAVALPEIMEHARREAGETRAGGAYLSLILTISAVIMRSWIQVGIMAYIPFYFIDVLKGDPVYAAKLVSLFLLGGTIGTLVGAPVADKWGHRFLLRASMLLATLVFPLIFIVKGALLFVVLFVLGAILVSSFSVTIVMAQKLLPKNLGIASGLMTGFAIGAGGIGVTLLGVVADHYGVYAALQSIGILPVVGFVLSMILKYPPEQEGQNA